MQKKKTDTGKNTGICANVDIGVYSAEALKLAAFIFDGRGIKISFKKNLAVISINGPESEKTFREFMNEALNQQCRIDLAAKNGKVARIIVTKAILSALGK